MAARCVGRAGVLGSPQAPGVPTKLARQSAKRDVLRWRAILTAMRRHRGRIVSG